MIVVDASVAVKWLLPEEGSDAARELLVSGKVLVAPVLVRTEVAGAILRLYRENRLTDSSARSVCNAWDQMIEQGILGMLSVEKVLRRAVDMSITARHKLPDCIYLAAAEEFDADVVTADVPMYERGQIVYGRVTLLNAAAPS